MATLLARSQVSTVAGTCRPRVKPSPRVIFRMLPNLRPRVSQPRSFYGYGCGPQDPASRAEYAKKAREFWQEMAKGMQGGFYTGPDGVKYNFDGTQADPSGQSLSLSVDVQEDENTYTIYADIPGVSKGDLSIRLSNEGVLTVSGERKALEGEGVKTRERKSGKFERKLTLPKDADPEGVSAKVTEGVLTINVWKKRQEPAVQDFKDIPVA
eukprot:jgi/Chrzof1/11419/Cz05g36020.t1